MKILIGSNNPVKVDATKDVFSDYFGEVEVIPVKVDSGVSNQPKNEEVFRGAENRALELKRIDDEQKMEADFFVGMEGGIVNLHPRWLNFNGTCVMDREGRKGYGTSPLFELPGDVIRQLLEGRELGDVMDEIFEDENCKQKGGAIGHFTEGRVERKDLCSQSLVMAMIPFLKKNLYSG